MVEAFSLLPATRALLIGHQTVLPQVQPPIITVHRLIQTLVRHMSQGLVVIRKDAVAFRNPRHYLAFPATEMKELKPIPVQIMKPNLKLRCKFKNPPSSLLRDTRQVSAPVYKVCQSNILSRIAKPVYQRVFEAFLAVNWQGCFSIVTTPTP